MDNAFLNRRFLVSFESRRIPHIFTDVLVIGAGAAGMRAAIEASKHGEVILLAKNELPDCNTWLAQGGLAAVTTEADSLADHVSDTLTAGADLCDEAIVESCLEQGPAEVEKLIQWGMPFDKQPTGEFRLGREGGHHANRILHADGDATGKILEQTLIETARSCPDVKIFENCFVLDLLTDPAEANGSQEISCLGVLTHHPRYGVQIIRARQTILAAGGAGVLWRETSNPQAATADAIAIAYRAGAKLSDLEMMQFHPTTLYVAGSTRSLISEAVRGEGAHLLDKNGVRFMHEYHDMKELAPRDVVARAILDRMVKTDSNRVYLDVSPIGTEKFAARFPHIAAKCRDFDITPGEDLIPVHPAAHYMIGGVKTDDQGRTNIKRLYACGEAACTGLHGANRLASNSLTEALVFGQRAGELAGIESAKEAGKPILTRDIAWEIARSTRTELDLSDIRNSLRSVMWRNVGIVREAQHLKETIEIIQFWGSYVLDKEFFADHKGWEVQNMLTSAWLVSKFALERTETRGVHFRSDFPDRNASWRRHQIVSRSPQQLIVG